MAVNVYRKFEGKSPLTSLVSGLEGVRAGLLEFAARKKSQIKTGTCLFFAGLVLTVVGATEVPLVLAVSIPAIVSGLGLLLYSLFTGVKLVNQHRRLEIAKELVTMIQPDAKPEMPFELRLNLWASPVQVSQEAWHGRKNGRQELLEEAWFSLEGPLLDGTVFTDEIKELQRKRTFSNARGKRKTKSRLTYLVSVRFSYSQERYGDARQAQQALKEDVKLGAGATLRSVRVTEKAVALKATVSLDKEIAPTVGMLSMGGYRILNLARRIAARQRGAA